MRPFYVEETKNFFRFSERTAGRVEADGERPDGRRRPFTLPTFFEFCRETLAELVCEH
jgi:hypothetical protein